MRMLILTAAVATLALSGTANAEEAHSFTHDGANYDYVVTQKGPSQIIAGKRNDGTKFRLVVRGDRVRGTLGTQQVSFGLNEVQAVVGRKVEMFAAR